VLTTIVAACAGIIVLALPRSESNKANRIADRVRYRTIVEIGFIGCSPYQILSQISFKK
jgi:hypothetical protein